MDTINELQYLNLLRRIMNEGETRTDRTGVGTLSVFGEQIKFDLRSSFPAITTKKLAWKACKAELLWFLEGSRSELRLHEITHGAVKERKSTIWEGNAYADYWLPKAEFLGDLGKIYGYQWRNWNGVDQVTNLVEGLIEDPWGRRHILSAWNVDQLDQMALPPCHVMSQYYVSTDGTLNCHMYQRSVDAFLGLPFNIASYALLTSMLAQVCVYKPGTLTISTGDTHIYLNHIEQVREQLSRTPYQPPTLYLDPKILHLHRFSMDNIILEGYRSHEAIKAPMAV